VAVGVSVGVAVLVGNDVKDGMEVFVMVAVAVAVSVGGMDVNVLVGSAVKVPQAYVNKTIITKPIVRPIQLIGNTSFRSIKIFNPS
jgi:hypothetical protein